MPSVLAIVSKAVFEKLAPKGVKVGELIATDRYVSNQPAFAQVGKDDALFLVTVRPPDEALWLVAVLGGIKRTGDAWVSAPNTRPIADITPLIKKLKFATGTGITAKKGALGMSLQTPRVLTPDDVALLRGGTSAKATAAVKEYRNQVDATPAAATAKAQAKAAAKEGGEVLRLVNYRRPFEMLDQLGKPQQKQLAQLTKQNRAGKPADLVDDEDWAPMELVDVLDVASNTVTHQLYIWPWGSGELFPHDTTKRAAVIIQHGLDQEVDDLPFRKALAAAYASADPQLAETVDFRLDRAPVPPPAASEVEMKTRLKELDKRLRSALGTSKETFRVYEELTKAQKAVIADILALEDDWIADLDLGEYGLPPYGSFRAWAGAVPPTPLEQRAGRWPVWKWIRAVTDEDIEADAAIKAVTKAMSADQIAELAHHVGNDTSAYDLYDSNREYEHGESYADAYQVRLSALLASLIDASGPDAAVAFATTLQRTLKDASSTLSAAASFALAARARRRGEGFPSKFFPLAEHAKFYGSELRDSLREVCELMTPAERENFVAGDGGPYFTTSYDEEVKGGKRVEVPKVLKDWHYVDLAPTDKHVKKMVLSILDWGNDKQPTQTVLDIIEKVGPVAIPHLKTALKKKTPYKTVLEKALSRLEKASGQKPKPPRTQ